MANLTNKTALVTGGSRGIGAAIATRLAAEGASVAITYTKGADAAVSVVKEIERAGGRKDRRRLWSVGCVCQQCRYGHSEAISGDDVGGTGSCD
jgi:NAD(P)-dependent dehydrogenase (short-subunit alcohol dehydrogenase family)